MVINTQMGGEAMWFWYATLFRQGVKLYSELHTALQPFFVLETAAWIGLAGNRIALYEVPSLVHALILAIGFWLLLRESTWPDWQKGILLLGSFVFTVLGHSYRFDDYHVIAEILILYAFVLLLQLGRPAETSGGRRTWLLVAALGCIAGLAFTTRVTDGAALVVAVGVSLPFLLRRGRALGLLLFAVVAALTVLFVVRLTHDTLYAYLMSSLFRAAGSKGGTGSIFAAPFVSFANGLGLLRAMKKTGLQVGALVSAAWAIDRYWQRVSAYIVPLQLALGALLFFASPQKLKGQYTSGLFYSFVVVLVTSSVYVVVALVLLRYVRSRKGLGPWDPREVLVVLPVLEWASYAAGAAGEPLTNYYAPVVLLLLLFPVLQPMRRSAGWVNPSLTTMFALVAFWGIYTKVTMPYSWQNYAYGPMFHNRQKFLHPVYGEMYIDRDLLTFSQRVCADIKAVPGAPGPELLSLPYPYPNYFCNTPPWHHYVQTFFDTTPRATVERMMAELEASPPQWIVYQRQLNIMAGSERLYNHGRPLAQRELDGLIMGKIAAGQWKLVDESDYLRPDWWPNPRDTDWYIIETHP